MKNPSLKKRLAYRTVSVHAECHFTRPAAKCPDWGSIEIGDSGKREACLTTGIMGLSVPNRNSPSSTNIMSSPAPNRLWLSPLAASPSGSSETSLSPRSSASLLSPPEHPQLELSSPPSSSPTVTCITACKGLEVVTAVCVYV